MSIKSTYLSPRGGGTLPVHRAINRHHGRGLLAPQALDITVGQPVGDRLLPALLVLVPRGVGGGGYNFRNFAFT